MLDCWVWIVGVGDFYLVDCGCWCSGCFAANCSRWLLWLIIVGAVVICWLFMGSVSNQLWRLSLRVQRRIVSEVIGFCWCYWQLLLTAVDVVVVVVVVVVDSCCYLLRSHFFDSVHSCASLILASNISITDCQQEASRVKDIFSTINKPKKEKFLVSQNCIFLSSTDRILAELRQLKLPVNTYDLGFDNVNFWHQWAHFSSVK